MQFPPFNRPIEGTSQNSNTAVYGSRSCFFESFRLVVLNVESGNFKEVFLAKEFAEISQAVLVGLPRTIFDFGVFLKIFLREVLKLNLLLFQDVEMSIFCGQTYLFRSYLFGKFL